MCLNVPEWDIGIWKRGMWAAVSTFSKTVSLWHSDFFISCQLRVQFHASWTGFILIGFFNRRWSQTGICCCIVQRLSLHPTCLLSRFYHYHLPWGERVLFLALLDFGLQRIRALFNEQVMRRLRDLAMMRSLQVFMSQWALTSYTSVLIRLVLQFQLFAPFLVEGCAQSLKQQSAWSLVSLLLTPEFDILFPPGRLVASQSHTPEQHDIENTSRTTTVVTGIDELPDQPNRTIKRPCKLRTRVSEVYPLVPVCSTYLQFFFTEPSVYTWLTSFKSYQLTPDSKFEKQIRAGLIQRLETAHLDPVAASSCDVMTLLWPVTSNGGHEIPVGTGPTGLREGSASESAVLESLSCVVSELWRTSDLTWRNECQS